MRGLVVLWLLAACTQATPRATVTMGHARTPRAVLVLPTACQINCDQRIGGQQLTLREEVDMLVRLKLELAGYTLAEAAAMKLETANRTTTETFDGTRRGGGTVVTPVQTLAELPFDRIVEAATSIGLEGIVVTAVASELRNYKTYTTITVELRALPDHAPVWRAVCGGFVTGGFARELSVQDLANCVGDGVLAANAPDALFRRLR